MPSILSDREFRFRWTWDLPADAETLWPLVSDTDAFNRDTGLPPVKDARREGEELAAARRRLRIAVAGVTLEWEELPFAWVRPRRFGVVRRYSRGPLAEMRVLAELEPLDGGATRLTYHVAARPSGLLGLLTIPLQIGVLSRRGFGKVFREYGELAAAGELPEPPGPPLLGPKADRNRLRAMRSHLVDEGVAEGVASRLSDHVARADDGTLFRMRPYVLAELWGMPRRPLLEACLHATRGGFLDLHWDVLCPLCRGVKESAPSLATLRRRGVHCDSCLIDFSGDFAESVELTFRPAPAVRTVEPRWFCVAGPQVTPHVVVQQRLEPGEERRVEPRLEPGRYRLREHGATSGVALTVSADGRRSGGGPSSSGASASAVAAFRVTAEGWEGSTREVGTAPVLRIGNGGPGERLVVLERTAWSDPAVTAAEVIRLAVFRDLFSDDVLRVGDFAEVGTLSVLFTDLKGSTRLYRRAGDAPAFGRVMEHFDVLRAAVLEADGAVVKTIGDAVMAVFPTPAAALRAALDAHRGLRERLDHDPRLVLKAGIHTGPSIAVTLDGRLDYFGTTVNVAARLEGMSEGDDVVVSDRVRRDPDVEKLVEARGLAADGSSREIRGLEDEPVTVWRIRAP